MSKQQEVPPAVEQDGLQEVNLTESDSQSAQLRTRRNSLQTNLLFAAGVLTILLLIFALNKIKKTQLLLLLDSEGESQLTYSIGTYFSGMSKSMFRRIHLSTSRDPKPHLNMADIRPLLCPCLVHILGFLPC